MDARMAHWRQKWRMPNTPWTITGYSRAAYRTGFYIPELDIMLDAGDHIASLPFSLIGDENGHHVFQIYAPAEAGQYLRRYIAALFEVNALVSEADMGTREWYQLHGFAEPTSLRIELNKSQFEVNVILCDHGIPTLSYCFSIIKRKLRDEYLHMSGKEIAALRVSGVDVTREEVRPAFAFICDTAISVLETYPLIAPSYPIVIIECTFLYPEELENAIATKHIHWSQLKPYKEEEVLDFFREERRLALAASAIVEEGAESGSGALKGLVPLRNLKIWAGDTSIDPFADEVHGTENVRVDHESFNCGDTGKVIPRQRDNPDGTGGCSCYQREGSDSVSNSQIKLDVVP